MSHGDRQSKWVCMIPPNRLASREGEAPAEPSEAIAARQG